MSGQRRTPPAIDWAALELAARTARSNAHAPYSGFAVGAAVLAGGRVFAGCNVENASYPVGLCAERGALAAAVAAGMKRIEAVLVVAGGPTSPCGMCRQALAEFGTAMPVRLVGDDGAIETDLAELLPSPFLAGDLHR
jgi:cytidine deaminase